jgi:hypothetical protein
MKACRKILPVLLALTCILTLLAGCGDSGTADRTVDMAQLREAMLAADKGLPDMSTVDGDTKSAKTQFAYLSTMDYSKVDDFFMAYASNGNQHADEIAVIAVKKNADVETAEKSLKNHLEKRRALYEQYDPSQLDRIDGAQVFIKGRYAVLILCDKQEAVKTAFQKALKEQK